MCGGERSSLLIVSQVYSSLKHNLSVGFTPYSFLQEIFETSDKNEYLSIPGFRNPDT